MKAVEGPYKIWCEPWRTKKRAHYVKLFVPRDEECMYEFVSEFERGLTWPVTRRNTYSAICLSWRKCDSDPRWVGVVVIPRSQWGTSTLFHEIVHAAVNWGRIAQRRRWKFVVNRRDAMATGAKSWEERFARVVGYMGKQCVRWMYQKGWGKGGRG